MLILATILSFLGAMAFLYAVIRIERIATKKETPMEFPPDGIYKISTKTIDSLTGNRTVEFTPVEDETK
jgi:hypothetical protein